MSRFEEYHFSFDLPDTVFPGQLICPEHDSIEKDEKSIVYRFLSGRGTMLQNYINNGTDLNAISATLIGSVSIKEEASESPIVNETKDEINSPEKDEVLSGRIIKNITVSVVPKHSKIENNSLSNDFANNLPKEGDVVLTRVTRISLQRANVEILAVENQAIPVDSGIGSNGTGVTAAQGGSGAATFSIAQASSDLGETFRGIIRSQDVRATERDSVKIIKCFKPGDIVRAEVLSLGDGTNYYLSTARNDLGVVFAKAANGAGSLMYAIDWQTMCVPSTGSTENRKCAKPF